MRAGPAIRVLALFVAACVPHVHASGATESLRFEIAPQSMSSALREFARISGCDIIFTEDVVAGFMSAPLSGDFTVSVALVHLLAGTGLTTELSPSGAYMVHAVIRGPVERK